MTRIKEWAQDRPLNTVHFESPSHMSMLLTGLNSLRDKGHLLDVTLVAGGQYFQAHRVVLASCSDYFRAMFTDAMRERGQQEICLNGITAEGMRLLLEYAYTSRLTLNLANIQDVLSMASHVQVTAVVEACSTYLQNQLDLDNCVDVATIAETYFLKHLRKRVYRFMCADLSNFSETSDFQRLSYSQLAYLLECDFPVDCTESQVLATVIRWIDFDRASRVPVGQSLLKNIHFDEIPQVDLKRFIDSKLFRLAYPQYSALCQFLTTESEPPVLVNSRGMEQAIVKVGGFGMAGITNEITYYLASVQKWRHLTTIPHVEQCNFGTAILNNELYVVGGCFNQSLQEHIHPFGFCYNPQYNKWTTLAPMLQERCRFSLNVVGSYMYAIGGSRESTEDNMDMFEDSTPCEKYDSVSDTWEGISPIPGHRTQHAGSVHKHIIFISGGLDHDFVLNTTMCYNTLNDTWTSKAPMMTSRADHCMLNYNGKLYVCGGWYDDAFTGNRKLAETIDEYDVSSDTWRTITRIPTPRYHAGVVNTGTKIFIVGGFYSDVTFDKATGIIECYDLVSGTWSTQERYPKDIWEHTLATLYVPRCRDDMEVLSDSAMV